MTTIDPAGRALADALLDALAAALNKKSHLTLPVLVQCGGEFAVFIRDPHDGRRGKRNRYAWSRHATEDQARFFFAYAPGQSFTTDKETHTNG